MKTFLFVLEDHLILDKNCISLLCNLPISQTPLLSTLELSVYNPKSHRLLINSRFHTNKRFSCILLNRSAVLATRLTIQVVIERRIAFLLVCAY